VAQAFDFPLPTEQGLAHADQADADKDKLIVRPAGVLGAEQSTFEERIEYPQRFLFSLTARARSRKSFHAVETMNVVNEASIGGAPFKPSFEVAIAWLLAQKPWIVPIPGTTKLHRLEENIGAAEVELTSYDLREIDSAASKIELQGARLPEAALQMTGR
jgi:hypothetical protein